MAEVVEVDKETIIKVLKVLEGMKKMLQAILVAGKR